MAIRRYTFVLENSRGKIILPPPALFDSAEIRDGEAKVARNSLSILHGVRARVRKFEIEWRKDR